MQKKQRNFFKKKMWDCVSTFSLFFAVLSGTSFCHFLPLFYDPLPDQLCITGFFYGLLMSPAAFRLSRIHEKEETNAEELRSSLAYTNPLTVWFYQPIRTLIEIGKWAVRRNKQKTLILT